MKKLILVLFTICIGFAFTANAQSVSGVITGADDGQPIPGVNIQVKGSATGTISEMNGGYTVNVAGQDAVLVFSYFGYKTMEIPVGGQSKIDVALEADATSVDEVVVIGYGSTAKKNVASSMSVIKSEDLVGMSTTDARQALQGKVAGVQVVNNGGDPGSGARIIVRGMGSFSSPEPLYVVDGLQGGDFNSIPPQDIESITVLKDAATTAIYGSAAANGVVLVTTKSGKKGNVKVTYDGSVGIAQVNKRYDMLNASDYVDLVGDIQAASGLQLTEKLLSPAVRTNRTDWQEEIFRNALVTDHNIRLSGGTDNVTYSFSTGYVNQESTIIDRNFQRLTFGAKLGESLFNRKVRFSQNLRVKTDKNSGKIANFNDALRMPTYVPVYDPNNLGGYGRADKVEDLNDANNPLNDVYNSTYDNKGYNVELDLSGEVDIISGLTFKTQARLWSGNGNNYTFNYPSNGGNFSKSSSDMEENFNTYSGVLLENFFTYVKTFGDHDISATLGNTYSPAGSSRSVNVKGSNFTSDAIQNVSLANTTSLGGANVNSGRSRLSYFGRIGYTYKEKYVFNGSIRKDGSSNFGENNRWGTFYGLGVAWAISKEDFMSSMDVISDLKLRASYGKTGNDNIPSFLTSATVWKGDANNIVYSFGDNLSYANGSSINSIANPNLKWEETTQFDIGIDLSILNNSLSFVLDYYNRANEDLLIETLLPLTSGLGRPGQSGTQWINAASMKNTGFEFSATYRSSASDFKWDVSVNTTYGTNEVTALGTVGDLPISKGEFVAGIGNSTRTDIGHPLASYYGYKVDHIVVDQAEVNQLNAAALAASSGKVTEYKVGLKPGDRLWQDTDGNGYIDDKDRTYIGNPSPKWQYGLTFNGAYKKFDFQLLVQGVAKVDVVNGGRYWWQGMSKPFNNTTDVLRRWKKEGDITDIPAAGQNSSANLAFSDWYVEKGDYVRLKNLVIGYTLPEFKNSMSLRMYVAFQNLLTITNYSGYDPEISSQDPYDNNNYIFQRGVDLYNHPNPAIYRFGVQFNF